MESLPSPEHSGAWCLKNHLKAVTVPNNMASCSRAPSFFFLPRMKLQGRDKDEAAEPVKVVASHEHKAHNRHNTVKEK